MTKREEFLEVLREQYTEQIHAAFTECQNNEDHSVDYHKLNPKLMLTMKGARLQGVSETEFLGWVKSQLPEAHDPFHSHMKNHSGVKTKKAA